MADVPESTPAFPVRPVRKDQGRFARKRATRQQLPVDEGEPAASSPSEDDDNAAPAEHIDTYA